MIDGVSENDVNKCVANLNSSFFLRSVCLLILLFLLVSCSSAVSYRPSQSLSPTEARELIEESLMSQRVESRPLDMGFEEKYVWFSYVVVTAGRPVTPASHALPQVIRFYPSSDSFLHLWRWKRGWYVVTIISEDKQKVKHLYYTKDLEKAKRLMDAFESL